MDRLSIEQYKICIIDVCLGQNLLEAFVCDCSFTKYSDTVLIH